MIHTEFSLKLNVLVSWKKTSWHLHQWMFKCLYFHKHVNILQNWASLQAHQENLCVSENFIFPVWYHWMRIVSVSVSVNQCHDNGNYHYFLFNYVSCILECGQLRFALVALKGQRFRGETFRHCVFYRQIVWNMTNQKNQQKTNVMFGSGTSHNCLFSSSK